MEPFAQSDTPQPRRRKVAPTAGQMGAIKASAPIPQENRQIFPLAASLSPEGAATAVAGEPRAAAGREKLVARCFGLLAQGRTSALSELYDVIAADLYGYIRSIVGSPADAEDVFQEVFAKVAARGPKLMRVERPLAYIFTIARNEAYSVFNNRAQRRQLIEESALLEEPSALPKESPRITASEAEEALAKLPEDQRETVVLKVYEGFTFAEIAGIMEVSANTAASRYRYGLAKLARMLRKTFRNG